jgi:twitching motility protein PilJ
MNKGFNSKSNQLTTKSQASSNTLASQNWNYRKKLAAIMLTISILPVSIFGILAYFKIAVMSQGDLLELTTVNTTEVKKYFAEQSFWLLTAIFIIIGLAGTLALILAEYIFRPILELRKISQKVIKQLNPEENLHLERDELTALETNLYAIEQQLPELLWQQEAENERFQLIIKIIQRLQQSRSVTEVFTQTTEAIRHAFQVDRVAILYFNGENNITIAAESVAANLPKILWTDLEQSLFESEDLETFRQGKIRVIDDIYQANLSDHYLNLLTKLAVKANLIAPLIKDEQLFGLLIIHQCSYPRHWQATEIDLISRIISQVGFAFNYANLLEELDLRATRSQQFIELSRQIRNILTEEEIFKITVEQMRKLLTSDRVMVYTFDQDWYGTVVAESVVPGFPKALWAGIKDPCFAEGYVEKYQAGRIQAVNNIYEAGLNPCHLQQLEPFAVKANLVAPILKDNQLFGLLIAHQCSAPRTWQPWEINFFSQVALQVGFALEHSRLLQQAENFAQQQNQQKQALQQQVFNVLYQAESIQIIYEQMQLLIDSLVTFQATAKQIETEAQQWQKHSRAIANILQQKLALEINTVETFNQLQILQESLSQIIETLKNSSDVTAQIKVQGMNGVIETARSQANSEALATLYQKIHSLAKQVEQNLSKIQPTLNSWQLQLEEANKTLTTNLISTELEQLEQQTEQQIQEFTNVGEQIKTSLAYLVQNSQQQIEGLTILKDTIAAIKQSPN